MNLMKILAIIVTAVLALNFGVAPAVASAVGDSSVRSVGEFTQTDCADVNCVDEQAPAADCTTRCFSSVTLERWSIAGVIPIFFLLFLGTSLTLAFPATQRKFTLETKWPYRPLYLFSTVRLLE